MTQSLAARIAALETRLDRLEAGLTGYPQMIRGLNRDLVSCQLVINKMLAALDLAPPTDEEIDAQIPFVTPPDW